MKEDFTARGTTDGLNAPIPGKTQTWYWNGETWTNDPTDAVFKCEDFAEDGFIVRREYSAA